MEKRTLNTSQKIAPPRLGPNKNLQVIAPARSLPVLSEQNITRAIKRLNFENLNVTFGENVNIRDEFDSSSVQARIDDLHQSFLDENTHGIITAIGGHNSNQLLPYLDYELIIHNPKILCGYSDITALLNAITAKTGLITYLGPHFASFGIKSDVSYLIDAFKTTLYTEKSFDLDQSSNWGDGPWLSESEDLLFQQTDQFVSIQTGEATGTTFGGNLCTFNLLQGTPYMPDLNNSILFLEDDSDSNCKEFDRNLTSLIQQKEFEGVKGIVFGRFQRASQISLGTLRTIIGSKRELAGLPIIAEVPFGHTIPTATLPIGGQATIYSEQGSCRIAINVH